MHHLWWSPIYVTLEVQCALMKGNFTALITYKRFAQEPQVDITQPSQVDMDGPLQLIDFEYSAPSYRGFDLGNHFNEYAGRSVDVWDT